MDINVTETAALTGTIVALVELVKWLVQKVAGGKKPGIAHARLEPETNSLIRELHDSTKKIEEIISLRDPDGIPFVYSPRSIVAVQKEIAEILRAVSVSQQRVAEVCERIEERLDDIESTTTRLVGRG